MVGRGDAFSHDLIHDAVLQGLPSASLTSNGQACFSCTRILVPASRYGEIVDAIATTVSSCGITMQNWPNAPSPR